LRAVVRANPTQAREEHRTFSHSVNKKLSTIFSTLTSTFHAMLVNTDLLASSMPHSRHRFPKPKTQIPIPKSPIRSRFPFPDSLALQLRIRCLIRSYRIAPIPYLFPAPAPRFPSCNPATQSPPCHATPGPARRGSRYRQAAHGTASCGGKESLVGQRLHGTTPRHPHSRIAIVTYKKKSPHHERNCFYHSLPTLHHAPPYSTIPVSLLLPPTNPCFPYHVL